MIIWIKPRNAIEKTYDPLPPVIFPLEQSLVIGISNLYFFLDSFIVLSLSRCNDRGKELSKAFLAVATKSEPG